MSHSVLQKFGNALDKLEFYCLYNSALMRNNTNYENIALNTTYKTSLNCFLIGLLDTNLN